jgi:V8-like Glu-specific endopeptidase
MRIFWLAVMWVLAPSASQAGVCPQELGWECFDATVILVSRDNQGAFKGLCSATAVDPTTLVTAAHCLEHQLNGEGYWDLHFNSFSHVDTAEQRIPSASGAIHPAYLQRQEEYSFDIGVVRLDTPLAADLPYVAIPQAIPQLAHNDTLHRIGFGLRPAGNVRNWVREFFRDFVTPGPNGTLLAADASGVAGDSGGAVYIHTPGRGLSLVALHSSWDFYPELNEYVSWSPNLVELRDWLEEAAGHALPTE